MSANKVFDNVQIKVGETRLDFLKFLAAQRNLHCIDDPQGNLHFFRTSAQTGNSNQALVEGVNILSARCLMAQNMQVPLIEVKAAQKGTDENNGPNAAQASATVYNANYAGSNRPFEMILETPVITSIANSEAIMKCKQSASPNLNASLPCKVG
jgi:prophage tail gpP-like protein